jgi:hypothetical protein
MRILIATLALGFAVCLANGLKAEKPVLPPGVESIDEEYLLSKVPKSYYFYYGFGEEPGKRLWTRIDESTFVERYPKGGEQRWSIVGRTKADGVDGIVVCPEKDNGNQAFIPSKGSNPMIHKWRANRDADWRPVGQMQEVE